jgi:hypothetical protein
MFVDVLVVGAIAHEEFEEVANPKRRIQKHVEEWDHRQYDGGRLGLL